MGKDGVISLGAMKRFKWRHLNEVNLGAVEGPVAAVADIGAGRGKEGLGMLDAGFRLVWLRLRQLSGWRPSRC